MLGINFESLPEQSRVPQGSILGLLLLFINANDLPDVANATSVALVADHTKCFWSIKVIKDDVYLQRDFDHIRHPMV